MFGAGGVTRSPSGPLTHAWAQRWGQQDSDALRPTSTRLGPGLTTVILPFDRDDTFKSGTGSYSCRLWKLWSPTKQLKAEKNRDACILFKNQGRDGRVVTELYSPLKMRCHPILGCSGCRWNDNFP